MVPNTHEMHADLLLRRNKPRAAEKGRRKTEKTPQVVTMEINGKRLRNASEHLLFHTKLCKFYPLGACTRGSNCAFAHDDKVLRKIPNLVKTCLCPELLMKNYCTSGDSCKYAHSSDDIRRVDDININEPKEKSLAEESTNASLLESYRSTSSFEDHSDRILMVEDRLNAVLLENDTETYSERYGFDACSKYNTPLVPFEPLESYSPSYVGRFDKAEYKYESLESYTPSYVGLYNRPNQLVEGSASFLKYPISSPKRVVPNRNIDSSIDDIYFFPRHRESISDSYFDRSPLSRLEI